VVYIQFLSLLILPEFQNRQDTSRFWPLKAYLDYSCSASGVPGNEGVATVPTPSWAINRRIGLSGKQALLKRRWPRRAVIWLFEATEPSLCAQPVTVAASITISSTNSLDPLLTRRCYVQPHCYCSTMMSPLVLHPCKVSWNESYIVYNTMHIFEPKGRMIAVIKDVYGEVVQQTLSNRWFSYIIIYVCTRFSFCISIFQMLPKNSYISYIQTHTHTHTQTHTHTHTCAFKCALKLAASFLHLLSICGNVVYSRTGHRWQYGACAVHAVYLRLQTHTR